MPRARALLRGRAEESDDEDELCRAASPACRATSSRLCALVELLPTAVRRALGARSSCFGSARSLRTR